MLPPAGTPFLDKLLWALGHPLVERRIVAAAALGEHRDPRALEPLKLMAHDPDPYLAAAAVRALAHYPFADVATTLQELAQLGPVPARRAAQQSLSARSEV